jgi:hypothetical protein
LREVATHLEALERLYCVRKLPATSLHHYVSLFKDLLEEVRGTEGVLRAQRNGGGVKGGMPRRYRSWRNVPCSSVLAVAGVHGEASAYLIHYKRSRVAHQGKARNATGDLWRELREHPATRKELEALETKLFRRYPPLREGLVAQGVSSVRPYLKVSWVQWITLKGKRMRLMVRTMVAPLGEVPDEETLREFGEQMRKAESLYQAHLLLDPRSDWETVRGFLWSILEKVRGEGGLRVFQVSGKGTIRGYVRSDGPLETSALVVVGVHAERSVYVFHYERVYTDWSGRVPDLASWMRRRLHTFPEAKRELESLERRLFQRYPGLEDAVRTLKAHPPFIGAVERGLAAFLFDATEEVTHVLVGKALFPIRYRLRPYSPEDVRQIPEGTLAETLWKRTDLKALAPETVLELLRGKGDVREAERVWALARLSEF